MENYVFSSSLAGVGRMDEPDTFLGRVIRPHIPHVRCMPPEKKDAPVAVGSD